MWDPRPEPSDEPWQEFDRWIKQPVRDRGMAAVIEKVEEWDRSPVSEWLKDIFIRADTTTFDVANSRESWRRGFTDLAVFRLPVLLFAGEFEDEDRSVHEIARLLPNAEPHLLPGVGHSGAFIRSELTLPIAREFLDRHFPWLPPNRR